MRTATLLLATALSVVPAHAQPTAAPLFVFHADDFWLNLHHFLYVLGRNEAGTPDRTRRAVVGAPADADSGLQTLTPEEQRTWREAVTAYAQGPSRQDAVFDEPLVNAGIALARVGPASALRGSGIDPAIVAVLDKAAAIYRKAWWPAHQRANAAWMKSTQALIDRHGTAMMAFLTRAYQLPWPSGGFPIRLSGYANWAGAYSTHGNLLVISSLDAGNGGVFALESSFHEAMHQWDEEVDAALSAEGKKLGLPVPDLLSHALIFYTAGEATRALIPSHVPYAEANGMWRQKGFGAFKQALDEVWKLYLNGKRLARRGAR